MSPTYEYRIIVDSQALEMAYYAHTMSPLSTSSQRNYIWMRAYPSYEDAEEAAEDYTRKSGYICWIVKVLATVKREAPPITITKHH